MRTKEYLSHWATMIAALLVLVGLNVFVWNHLGNDWSMIYTIILVPVATVFLLQRISGSLVIAIILSIVLSAASLYVTLYLYFADDPKGPAISILVFLLRSGVAVATGVLFRVYIYFRVRTGT